VGSSSIVYIKAGSETMICQDKSGVIRFYELEKNGYVIKNEVLTNYAGFARSIKIDDDRNLLLSPGEQSDINFYDVERYESAPLHKLSFTTEKTGQIFCMKDIDLTEPSSHLLAGYESGHLVLWNLKEMEVMSFVKYDFPVCSVEYDSSTHRGIASAPTISKLCTFHIDIKNNFDFYKSDPENVECKACDDSSKKVNGISALKLRPDKKCLFVGFCDGSVNIYSWKFMRKLTVLRNHRSEITDFSFSSHKIDNYKSLITAISSTDGNVSLWNIYYK
jgi:WD40 repeat protein